MRFEELLQRHERGALTQAEAGEMLGMSERTFRRWRERYREEGATGLSDRRVSASTASTSAGVERGPRTRRGRHERSSARRARRYSVARETPTASAACVAVRLRAIARRRRAIASRLLAAAISGRLRVEQTPRGPTSADNMVGRAENLNGGLLGLELRHPKPRRSPTPPPEARLTSL